MKTTLQQIQDLNWFDFLSKLKSIASRLLQNDTELGARVTELEAAEGGIEVKTVSMTDDNYSFTTDDLSKLLYSEDASQTYNLDGTLFSKNDELQFIAQTGSTYFQSSTATINGEAPETLFYATGYQKVILKCISDNDEWIANTISASQLD